MGRGMLQRRPVWGDVGAEEYFRTGLPKGLSREPAPSHPAMGTLLFWVSLPMERFHLHQHLF